MARSHSGINLAETFTSILTEYGIENKVSLLRVTRRAETMTYRGIDVGVRLRQRNVKRCDGGELPPVYPHCPSWPAKQSPVFLPRHQPGLAYNTSVVRCTSEETGGDWAVTETYSDSGR